MHKISNSENGTQAFGNYFSQLRNTLHNFPRFSVLPTADTIIKRKEQINEEQMNIKLTSHSNCTNLCQSAHEEAAKNSPKQLEDT